jgi:hypothetical protein
MNYARFACARVRWPRQKKTQDQQLGLHLYRERAILSHRNLKAKDRFSGIALSDN